MLEYAAVEPRQVEVLLWRLAEECIWSYDYDLHSRSIRGEQPFFQGFERGAPDG